MSGLQEPDTSKLVRNAFIQFKHYLQCSSGIFYDFSVVHRSEFLGRVCGPQSQLQLSAGHQGQGRPASVPHTTCCPLFVVLLLLLRLKNYYFNGSVVASSALLQVIG